MADEAGNWTEHTHGDGRRYYYNRVTKASAWDKPDCLKSADEKANTTMWKEYKTAQGRDYFYNPVTKQSVWEMPIELKRLRGLAKKDDESDEEGKEEKEESPDRSTPEERRQAFKDLLEDKQVKGSMKWDEALKLIQDDKRFNRLPTAGERKQVFAEWVTQSKKRAKDEEREKKKRAKDDFLEALASWEDLKPGSRYKDAAEAFIEQEWFKLMEEEERDELFQDFMEEHEKKNKDVRRKQRKEYVEKIQAVYAGHKEISMSSKWQDVRDLLRDNKDFKWLSKLEQLTSWEEYVLDTAKQEIEVKSKVKFRHERKARDAFRGLLKEIGEKGKIKTSTQWQDVAKLAHKDERYVAMIGTSGSTPHELFDDYIDDLNDKYKDDRAKIKKWAKAKGVVITSTTTYDQFHDKLKDEEGFLDVPEEHRKMVLESLVEKAKEQDEDVEKTAKKNRKRFVELLQKTREVTAGTTYEAATKLLGKEPAWDAVDDQTRRQCFVIFVDQLKIQSAARKKDDGKADKGGSDDDADESDEDDRKKAKKKKRKAESEEPEPKKGKKKKAEPEEDDEGEKKKKRKK